MAPQSSRSTLPPKSGLQPPTSRTRPRKPLSQAINTNVNSYPRTEPIKALNVLLKLLTSLPSRMGGCQYKLTQPEHALSLHLISILDPFVYHGARALVPNPVSSGAPLAPSFGLVDQPTEIIDAILFHVDSRKDLLSIGLGCKRLYDVVFPRHFDYRVIRCKVSSISVWNHLMHHRSLARNVRRLEILDERASSRSGTPVCVPRGILKGDTDLESTDDELSMHVKQERFLAAALVRMTGLKEFKWSCNHSPISIAHIWPTLMMRAVNLNAMEICDNLLFAPVKTQDEENADSESDVEDGRERGLMTSMPTSALPGMNTVIFRSTPHTYGAAKNPELGRISAMLHQCLNLKHLEVVYISPRSHANTATQGTVSRTRPLADEFLMYGRWENLTTLYLSNLRCVSPDAPSSFLSAHPSLEVLHMDVNIHGAHLVLANGALPRLREVKASRDVVNAILACPSEGRRPLEVIKGFKLSGNNYVCQNGPSAATSRSASEASFLSNLRQCGSGIRRIELAGWHDMEDIRKLAACVPNLQYLDVGRRLGGAAARVDHQNATANMNRSQGVATNMVEWAELMSTMPELTAMHGVRFFYEVSAAAMGTAASTLAPNTSCPLTDSFPSSFSPHGASPSPTLNAIPSPAKSQAQTLSMMERSRMRKNDEIASVLVWKCPKLRRVDYWEEGAGKVVVLLSTHDEGGKEREGKARWEVRRVRA